MQVKQNFTFIVLGVSCTVLYPFSMPSFINVALGPFNTGASVQRILLSQWGIAILISIEEVGDRSCPLRCAQTRSSLWGNQVVCFHLIPSDPPDEWKI